jgi:hypothetical protein
MQRICLKVFSLIFFGTNKPPIIAVFPSASYAIGSNKT